MIVELKKNINISSLFIAFMLLFLDITGKSNNLQVKDGEKAVFSLNNCLYILEDTSNSYQFIDQVINNPHFKKVSKSRVNIGFTNSSYWVRFNLENGTGKDLDLLFSFEYPLINTIEFYQVNNNDIVKKQITGDLYPFHSREIPHHEFVFHIKLPKNASHSIYLKLQNQGESLRIPLSLHNYTSFFTTQTSGTIFNGIFYGLLIFIIVFNFFLIFSLKERLYLFYNLFVIALTFFLLSTDGLAYKFLWPGSPYLANHIPKFTAALTAFALLKFMQYLLELQKTKNTANTIINITGFIIIILCVVCWFSHDVIFPLVTILIHVFAAISSIIVITFAIVYYRRKQNVAFYFLLSFFLFMCGVLTYVLRNSGLLQDSTLTEYGLKLGFAFQVITLLFAITERFRRMKDETRGELIAKARSRTREIEQQSKQMIQQTENIIKANKELEKLSLVAQKTDNGVTVFNRKGEVLYQNHGVYKLFGYQYKDILKKTNNNPFDIDSNKVLKRNFYTCIQEKKTVIFDTKHNTGDKDLWIQTTLSPVFKNSQIDRVVAINSDVTRIKKNKEFILKKNINITNSILTAQKIQKAILPGEELLQKHFPGSFIFYEPKDIVSGDLYWEYTLGPNIILAAVDCTGHGVSGALMTFIAYTHLNKAVKQKKITIPANILNYVNESINKALRITNEDQSLNEGFDISIININTKEQTFQYAGAHNSMFMISGNNIQEYKADKYPIGIYYGLKNKVFTNRKVNYNKGDRIYLFTDGITDQFGGTNNRKFLKKRFKQTLMSIQEFPINEQKHHLIKRYMRWKGNIEQIDDILVMGIEL